MQQRDSIDSASSHNTLMDDIDLCRDIWDFGIRTQEDLETII